MLTHPGQVEQYQNFSISYKGEEYSKPAAAAAGENIADNGGGKAVYQTYERLPEAEKQCVPGFNFTSDQLFWVEILNAFLVKLDQLQISSLATHSIGAPTVGVMRTLRTTDTSLMTTR